VNQPRHRIPRVGLTGGIGSGKSTALAYLHELGAAVVSSDDIVHGLYSRPEIVAAIRERYGDEVAHDDTVNRRALARIVFHELRELQWLEGLLHPHVRAAVGLWAAEQERATPRPSLLVAEVPLLFETDMERDFDFTILITAPADLRRRRLAAKLTDSEFARRLSQQMPEEEKLARSDFAFANAGSRKNLKAFVGETAARILAGEAGTEGARLEEGPPA
jgi:dephospho-CoA kinase